MFIGFLKFNTILASANVVGFLAMMCFSDQSFDRPLPYPQYQKTLLTKLSLIMKWKSQEL